MSSGRRRPPTRRARALVATVAAALGACAPPVAIAPPPTASIADSTLTGDDLLARLDKRYGALVTFRALADMEYRGPKDRGHVKEIVVVERPDRLRIEMMSPFGVALQLTSDGKSLRAYHRGQRTFYSGDATAPNLSRFTHLDLAIRDIADLLVGVPPNRPRRRRAEMEFENATKLWRVRSVLAEGGAQMLWFEQDRLLAVRSEEVDSEGAALYRTSYGDYRPVRGVLVPFDVRFEVPNQQTSVELRYSTIQVNEPLSEAIFRFDAPSGAKLVDLDVSD